MIMKLTCGQMEILMSFYLEGELSKCLKEKADEHLRECKSCTDKYEMVKTLYSDMRKGTFTNTLGNAENIFSNNSNTENIFKTNLSAYMDNELPEEESIKIKKIAITNKIARKELEDSYNIRRLMHDSFKKTKAEVKQDYAKAILKQLKLDEEAEMEFHPAITLLIVFTLTVLIGTTIVLLSMSA